MAKGSDIALESITLYFLPVRTRVPLKFGTESLDSVICARAKAVVRTESGRVAEGWGETPLSVQWVWPSTLSHESRRIALEEFTKTLARQWAGFGERGHAFEIGHAFIRQRLPAMLVQFNAGSGLPEPMPWLAALVCCSVFDLALHDAFGNANEIPVYQTYGPEFLSKDLSHYLEPAEGSQVSFRGKFPEDFLQAPPANHRLPAWHLVGGKDPVTPGELTGDEPKDGYPALLSDWIKRDGLTCLKIKLRGNDAAWDYQRIIQVAQVGQPLGVVWLTADFNCTVSDPAYVNAILDQLLAEHPLIYGSILYVEQPFPYELAERRIDVHSVSARKPLFMDESAHDWEMIRLGRTLGWSGVALKTCKTQTGALLSLCWARAHGMTLMVQDLTNPMLAQISHVQLAAHAGTIMGVETNSMQFYPEASAPEAAAHPGLFQRRGGEIDLSSLRGSGFGYRMDEIQRELPEPVCQHVSPTAGIKA
jgi:L-alanine-DL-glutamate epimerase-like enolase superfamily enzyme